MFEDIPIKDFSFHSGRLDFIQNIVFLSKLCYAYSDTAYLYAVYKPKKELKEGNTIMNNIEKTSFEEFYSRYYTQIVRYICKKIGHPEEAEDLAGDVFCICYHFT